MNFYKILMNFIFAILTQHHTQSSSMIITSKCHLVKQFIIHHRTLILYHFQLQRRKVMDLTVSI